MVYLRADDTWLMKDLAMFVEPVEIADKDGKLIGLFVPANLERGKELYARQEALLNEADLEKRELGTEKGFTTKEVFEHLLGLTEDQQMRDHLKQVIERLAKEEECATP